MCLSDDSAGELVNPFTTKTQPETEQLAAELYKRSHGVYDVGERVSEHFNTPPLMQSLQ